MVENHHLLIMRREIAREKKRGTARVCLECWPLSTWHAKHAFVGPYLLVPSNTSLFKKSCRGFEPKTTMWPLLHQATHILVNIIVKVLGVVWLKNIVSKTYLKIMRIEKEYFLETTDISL